MTTECERPVQQLRQNKCFFAPPEKKRQTIAPSKRWLLIREKAYAYAQNRAFVGGDLLKDWLEAEKEIDDKYVMNDRDVDSLAERAEIEEKVQRVLAAYGLADLSTAALLGKYSHAMKKLSSRSVAGR